MSLEQRLLDCITAVTRADGTSKMKAERTIVRRMLWRRYAALRGGKYQSESEPTLAGMSGTTRPATTYAIPRMRTIRFRTYKVQPSGPAVVAVIATTKICASYHNGRE